MSSSSSASCALVVRVSNVKDPRCWSTDSVTFSTPLSARANETEVVTAGRDVDVDFWMDFEGEAAFFVCG